MLDGSTHWIRQCIVSVDLGRLPLRFGGYHVEASIRGEAIGDVFDHAVANLYSDAPTARLRKIRT